MRRSSLAFVFVACVGLVAAQSPGVSFAPVLPDGVGDVAGWEIVSGEFEATTLRGAYRFYVSPSRAAMYQLMRYRVELVSAESAQARGRGGAERVAFVRRPGVREPIACWEKQAPGVTPPWRRIGEGTAEYRLEMAVLMQVLAVHREVRARQAH